MAQLWSRVSYCFNVTHIGAPYLRTRLTEEIIPQQYTALSFNWLGKRSAPQLGFIKLVLNE